MIVVNFAHPLTPEQLQEIEQLTGETIERVIEVPSQIDLGKPLGGQIWKMIQGANLPREEWASGRVIVNLPSLNYSAAAVVIALRQYTNSFVPFIQMARVDGVPPRFEVVRVVSSEDLSEVVEHSLGQSR